MMRDAIFALSGLLVLQGSALATERLYGSELRLDLQGELGRVAPLVQAEKVQWTGLASPTAQATLFFTPIEDYRDEPEALLVLLQHPGRVWAAFSLGQDLLKPAGGPWGMVRF